MAAPHIAGVVALMLSVNPALTHQEIKDILKNNAINPGSVDGDGPTAPQLYGAGTVDAEACVQDAITVVTRLAHAEDSSTQTQTAVAPATAKTATGRRAQPALADVLTDIEERLAGRPAWHLVAALVSRHLDEVLRLINTQKKVGAVWQRFGGPALVRKIISSAEQPDPPIPRAVDSRDMKTLVENLLPILDRFAGPALQSDIRRFGALAREVPGRRLDDLDAMLAGKTI